MENQFNKVDWKNMLVVLAVSVPIIITILSSQKLLELNFKLFSQEELLLLIPRDGGVLLFMLGVTLLYTSLAGLLLSKKTKDKKVFYLMSIIGVCISILSLQVYTSLTPNRLILTNVSKLSREYIDYSRVDKIHIEMKVRPPSKVKSLGSCHPYFKISGTLNSNESFFVVNVAPVDKDLAYRLIDVFKVQKVPTQYTLINNCENHPERFKELETEFNLKSAD